MGAFNLLHVNVRCSKCKNEFPSSLQFKAGDAWQYEYRIGNKLQVEVADREIVEKQIVAYGILENAICPSCGYSNQEEYNIYIDNCVITCVDDAINLTQFLDANDGRYF